MKHSKEAVLVYCMVGGQLRHVSEFAHLTPGQRPPATCPECDRVVVMKLGRIKIFHAAHSPGASCALTNPETALHFNTKVYIHQQLLKGTDLFVARRCTGYDIPAVGSHRAGHIECRRSRQKPHLWASGWTRVEMERYTGSRKPDIVLYSGEGVLGAIEVCVTHAVDEQKAADLLAQGVQWVEVKAEEDFEWEIGDPLHCSQMHPAAPPWTCEVCQAAPAKYVERMTALIKQTEESQRKHEAEERRKNEEQERYYGTKHRVRYAKTVFVYKYGGHAERHEVHLCEFDDGVFLRYGREGRILAEERRPLTRESFRRLEEDYQNWRGTLGLSNIVVEASRWLPLPVMIEELRRYVRPYHWNPDSRKWEPVELFPQTTTDSLTDVSL